MDLTQKLDQKANFERSVQYQAFFVLNTLSRIKAVRDRIKTPRRWMYILFPFGAS